MARFVEHPKLVPCPACSANVKREDTKVTVKAKGGKIIITQVPQYECSCGMLFIPQEAENLISGLQKDKKLKLTKDITVSYQDLRNKGKRILG